MTPDAYLENRILSADPVELIQILYEHAQRYMRAAREALVKGDIAGRTKAISRVIGILGELEGSLDLNAGGAISQNLAGLYKYMRGRLSTGNLKQEDGPLAEVENLLKTLASAWNSITSPAAQGAATEAPPVPGQVAGPPGLWGGSGLAEAVPTCAEHSWTA